jgi:mannitol PTS system EIICBA or EIICB component
MKFKNHLMKFGRALSAMIMPNIGAFIAWGLLTALFIPSGWWPDENLAKIVTPALNYLLPLLIAYTAGRNIAGERGGVTGAIAAVGVIAGTDIPMFIGAMIMGPLGGAAIKYFDKAVEGRVRTGFEMLVNNFSIGIIGMLLAILGFSVVGGIVEGLTKVISDAAQAVISHGLLPLVSIVVEPAKVLFLNNAINHGIFSPVGIEQVHEIGRSVMFLIEANPGAGLGVLLAYWIAGRGSSRSSAPGAVVIHLFGGIHEIYFPYVLAKPLLLLALIAGSASSLLFFSLTGSGLVAPASPGSIISVLAMAPKGETFTILCGVLIAAAVSLAVAIPIVRRNEDQDEAAAGKTEKDGKEINLAGVASSCGGQLKIMFACDAGMGSSALGATKFRKRAGENGSDALVRNCAVDAIPGDIDIVVCQNSLKARAEEKIAANVRSGGKRSKVVGIDNFISDPALDHLLEAISAKDASLGGDASLNEYAGPVIGAETDEYAGSSAGNPDSQEVLAVENILVGLASQSREEAILRAGRLLESRGYVRKGYAEAMLEREKMTSTYIGMGIAIPHGTDEAKEEILSSGVVILQYPEGVDFDGEKAYIIAGIAGKGDEHMDILAALGEAFEDEGKLKTLMTAKCPEDIFTALKN